MLLQQGLQFAKGLVRVHVAEDSTINRQQTTGKGGNPEDHDVDVHLYGCLPGYATEYSHESRTKIPVHPDAMPSEAHLCVETNRCMRNHKAPYVEYGDAV